MESIIQIFRMTELSAVTRENIIKKLGIAINNQYDMNITEELVNELVKALYKN